MNVRGGINPLGLSTFLRGHVGVKCGKFLKPKIKIKHYLEVDEIEVKLYSNVTLNQADGLLVTEASIDSLEVDFNEKARCGHNKQLNLRAVGIGGKIFQPLAQLIVRSVVKRLKSTLDDVVNGKVRNLLNRLVSTKLPFKIQLPDEAANSTSIKH